MKLWDNDLRNIYKQPELNAYYWSPPCPDFCWKAPGRVAEDVKKKTEDIVDNTKKAWDTSTNWVSDRGNDFGNFVQKTGQGAYLLSNEYGNKFGNLMQGIGNGLGISGGIGTVANKFHLPDLGNFINSQIGKWLFGKHDEDTTNVNTASDDTSGNETKAETDKAATTAAGAGAASEREAANTARESGMNSARAGNMAGSNNSAQALTNGLYQAGAAQNAATQADYRDKMSQADIMDTQAGNMAKGAKLMPWDAGLQGLAQGFGLGALLSDENSKEAPADGIDDDKLKEAIEKFKSLYAQLQEIKKWEC